MSKTVIPSDVQQERRMNNPGQNEKFVGSRQGGSNEHHMTKSASQHPQNPEYFKRQTDRKNADRFGMKGRSDESAREKWEKENREVVQKYAQRPHLGDPKRAQWEKENANIIKKYSE